MSGAGVSAGAVEADSAVAAKTDRARVDVAGRERAELDVDADRPAEAVPPLPPFAESPPEPPTPTAFTKRFWTAMLVTVGSRAVTPAVQAELLHPLVNVA